MGKSRRGDGGHGRVLRARPPFDDPRPLAPHTRSGKSRANHPPAPDHADPRHRHALVSPRRTARVAPALPDRMAPIVDSPPSPVAARAEPERDTAATPPIPRSPVSSSPDAPGAGHGFPPRPSSPSGGGIGGAPSSGAAVSHLDIVLTPALRDSIIRNLILYAEAPRTWRQLTPDEKVALRLQEAPGLSPVGRAARLPGEPMYAPLMSGGASIAIAAVSLGGRRDRRREDSLNADYRAHLLRLQAIIARRDSIRRDSIARARIHP